ncbi:hypothetical protein Rcae01_05702 [Novipirellula caenicola]|uniref:Uncharacterized protein n=1 Tax=Novipirellula caenicola TaxID=1536901 RepID=A0ABP9VYM1_9BACT
MNVHCIICWSTCTACVSSPNRFANNMPRLAIALRKQAPIGNVVVRRSGDPLFTKGQPVESYDPRNHLVWKAATLLSCQLKVIFSWLITLVLQSFELPPMRRSRRCQNLATMMPVLAIHRVLLCPAVHYQDCIIKNRCWFVIEIYPLVGITAHFSPSASEQDVKSLHCEVGGSNRAVNFSRSATLLANDAVIGHPPLIDGCFPVPPAAFQRSQRAIERSQRAAAVSPTPSTMPLGSA